MQSLGRRQDGDTIGDPQQRVDRDVLEFVGNDIAAAREFGKRGRIVERAADYFTRIGCGRRVRRVEELALDAHFASCKAQHLAELPGADNANAHRRR